MVELWLPPTLQTVPDAADAEAGQGEPDSPPRVWAGGAVEFDKVVPPSGNMYLAGKQLWLGPARAGQVVRVWADCDLIHLLIGGTRVKTIRSHLGVTDLAGLVAGAVNAGPSPLPAPEHGDAVEVERVVSRYGLIALGAHRLVAADILAGRHVGVSGSRRTR